VENLTSAVLLGLKNEERREEKVLIYFTLLSTQIFNNKRERKMSTLLETLYSQLTKTTEGSNKFYNIHIRPCLKGQVFEGNDKTCSQNGFEVYSYFGKIDGNFRKRHIGFFYSNEAAIRSAERIKESKRQKGYLLKNTLATPTSKKVFMNAKAKTKKTKALFKTIPEIAPKMTPSQKNRFSDLID